MKTARVVADLGRRSVLQTLRRPQLAAPLVRQAEDKQLLRDGVRACRNDRVGVIAATQLAVHALDVVGHRDDLADERQLLQPDSQFLHPA